ncbi:hypothetical protein HYG86_05260 [Alkalicella caledoniensis]|uniref:Uncharacterized protein n=1 Tax=Alkalicella caledoniensis TaxID=2731377 RepID=A0A7G9W6A9_ALKCA|nr:hypothetical protein [Alkalicella caledoniensis]QNO14221.1 hypothetical protein HYG86_05260 [Alkalicella caledoniensis]
MGGFRKIFWGFILVFFHIRINRIDFLPDVVGFILVVVGLSNLEQFSDKFETAKKVAIPVAILSIFSLYHFEVEMVSFIVFLDIVYSILKILLVYYICMGIIDVSLNNAEEEFADLAQKRWKLYLVMSIAALFSILILMVAPIMILVVIIGSIVASVLFLMLLNQADIILNKYLK